MKFIVTVIKTYIILQFVIRVKILFFSNLYIIFFYIIFKKKQKKQKIHTQIQVYIHHIRT